MKNRFLAMIGLTAWAAAAKPAYPVVDTSQSRTFNKRSAIASPGAGEPFYGQDAQYTTNPPDYQANGVHSAKKYKVNNKPK